MPGDKIVCPYCDRSFDLDQVEVADLFHDRLDLAARLGTVWRIANEYLDCFRTVPGGRINLKKRVRHLKAVCRLWEHAEFEYDGKRFRTNKPEIRRAMTTVCEAEKSGFTNHNYLKKCLLDTAQRISTEGLTAKEESGIEAGRRAKVAEKAEKNEGIMTAQEFMKAQGLRSLTETIGRKAT